MLVFEWKSSASHWLDKNRQTKSLHYGIYLKSSKRDIETPFSLLNKFSNFKFNKHFFVVDHHLTMVAKSYSFVLLNDSNSNS